MSHYDVCIVGAGFAGSVSARALAERGKRVLLIDRRHHIGGNAYDEIDEAGVLIHRYGPHIFHTNDKQVFDFLSRFTEWNGYQHRVLGRVGELQMPIPFNLDSLAIAFPGEEGQRLHRLLVDKYGENRQISIHALREAEEESLRRLGEYVYEHIFLHYTAKQWGIDAEQVDVSVTSRVPVRIGYDDRYFTDTYQGLPTNSFTSLFERMLDHPMIELALSTDSADRLTLADGVIYLDGEVFDGHVIYSGMPDELFSFCYGHLPYRSLDFEFKTIYTDDFQGYGTVNYTMSEDYTRITEFKHMTGQKIRGVTTVLYEYPRAFDGREGQIPYYSIQNEENQRLYQKYREEAAKYPKLKLLGRLAEYKYYNMDAITGEALKFAASI